MERGTRQTFDWRYNNQVKISSQQNLARMIRTIVGICAGVPALVGGREAADIRAHFHRRPS